MIILDNGHGNNTAGKRSPVWSDGTQLFEWEFNRDIVRKIYNKLNELNILSNILVPEAIDISLRTRVNRANSIYRMYPNSFLLSIHGNAAERPNEGTGWEGWTAIKDPVASKSHIISTLIYKYAKIELPQFNIRTDYTDGYPDKESKFYILVNTLCPAVLTENLFYDNEKDCKFMMSEIGREKIAKLHIEAIIEFLSTN